MIEVLTYATHDERGLRQMEDSATQFGIEVCILGWGRAFAGLMDKLRGVYQYLRTKPPSHRVLFVDAYDVVFVGGIEAIEERVSEFGDVGLVMSAERNCFPHGELAGLYPPCDTPYRYLNSGAYTGTAETILEVLDDLMLWRLPCDLNDQEVLSDWYVAHPHRFALDTQCRLFQSLHGAEADMEYGDVVRNTTTGTCPLVVHGNGRTDMSAVLAWLERRG